MEGWIDAPPGPSGAVRVLQGFCDQVPKHEQQAGAEHGRYGTVAPKQDQDYESDRCGHHMGLDSVLAHVLGHDRGRYPRPSIYVG